MTPAFLYSVLTHVPGGGLGRIVLRIFTQEDDYESRGSLFVDDGRYLKDWMEREEESWMEREEEGLGWRERKEFIFPWVGDRIISIVSFHNSRRVPPVVDTFNCV
jgi:hypothetical protein